MDVISFEDFPSGQKGELYKENAGGYACAAFFDEVYAGLGCSSCCKEVVYKEYTLAGLDCIGVHLNPVTAVFEGIFDR